MQYLILITGVITCFPVIYTLFPKFSIEKLNKTPYEAEKGFYLQHWGILCLMMGLSIIYVYLNPEYQTLILTMAVFEKLSLVLLVLTGFLRFKNEFYKSMLPTMIFDFLCSIFYIYIIL